MVLRIKSNKMKNIKLNIVFAAMLLLSAWAATAQADAEQEINNQPKKSYQALNEFSVYAKGPFSTLNFDLGVNGTNNTRYGVGLGIQYSRYISQSWSLSAGLEYQSYRSEALLPYFSDQYNLVDNEGDPMVFQAKASSIREWQNFNMLNIPLKVQVETKIKETWFYLAAGFQVGIPIETKYKSTVYNLETSGYFPQWDALLEDPAFMGFGSWGTVNTGKQKLDIENSYSLLLDFGFKGHLKAKRDFYIGAYAELGLNNLGKENDIPVSLVDYTVGDPASFQINSVVNSSPGRTGESFSEKFRTQSLGVKFRYAFSW